MEKLRSRTTKSDKRKPTYNRHDDSGKMISTTVYMTPTQSAALTAVNRATKIPKSVLIRQGIDLVLSSLQTQDADEELPREDG